MLQTLESDHGDIQLWKHQGRLGEGELIASIYLRVLPTWVHTST